MSASDILRKTPKTNALGIFCCCWVNAVLGFREMLIQVRNSFYNLKKDTFGENNCKNL